MLSQGRPCFFFSKLPSGLLELWANAQHLSKGCGLLRLACGQAPSKQHSTIDPARLSTGNEQQSTPRQLQQPISLWIA